MQIIGDINQDKSMVEYNPQQNLLDYDPQNHHSCEDLSNCLFQSSHINLKSDLRLSPYFKMLLGENVWLRPVFPNDAPGLFSILTNPEQMRYLGSGRVYTQEECCAMITRMANNTLSVFYFPEDLLKENAVSFSWSFFNHQGLSGIIKIFKSTNLTGEDCLEIAYYGKGGTCAAAKIVLDTLDFSVIALDTLTDFSVVATCHPLNTKSIKILRQNSFKLIKENIPKYGSIRDYYERKPII